MRSITITIANRYSLLSPNKRQHWAARARNARYQRGEAYFYATKGRVDASIMFDDLPFSNPIATVKAYFKRAQFPDRDNLIASLKSAFDGLQDARIYANDSELRIGSVESFKDAVSPRVEITIEEQLNDQSTRSS